MEEEGELAAIRKDIVGLTEAYLDLAVRHGALARVVQVAMHRDQGLRAAIKQEAEKQEANLLYTAVSDDVAAKVTAELRRLCALAEPRAGA